MSVTLGKDRHIRTVMFGKDRHIHIRIYACAHECQSTENEIETGETGDCSGETEKAGKRESATEYFRLVEGERFCCSLYKQPLMNKIVNGS